MSFTTFKSMAFFMNIKPFYTSPPLDLLCEAYHAGQTSEHVAAVPGAYDSDEESTSSSSLDGESADSQTSDSCDSYPSSDEEQYADAEEYYNIPLIIVTPPTDREPSFFVSSMEPAFLDAQPWSFLTIYSQLTNGAGAMSLLYASMGDPVLRRNIAQAYALARKMEAKASKASPTAAQELQIEAELTIGDIDLITPSIESFVNTEDACSPADDDTPTACSMANSTRAHAPEPESDEAHSSHTTTAPTLIFDTETVPEEAHVTLQDLLADFDDSATRPIHTIPLIVITEPASDDIAPPPAAPAAHPDPTLLDATKWDFLRFRLILSNPQRAGTLERQAKQDPRVARQVAQVFAVARRQGIALPSFEESAHVRREDEERKRAMAEEWQRTLARAARCNSSGSCDELD